MKVDYCFILAAGFGTRMGVIGKELPKIIWPVFEKRILELQVEFALSLGIKKIAFNLHYQKELILDFVKSKEIFSDVEFFIEEEILDIGGGIHNFAKARAYKGNVLILNSDQFLMFDKLFIDSLKDEGQIATLFTKKVLKEEKYNQLVINHNELVEVTPFSESKYESFDTYTGCSIIKLERLKPCDGASKFFDTVATYRNEKVICVDCNEKEYNDFGTKLRYYESIMAILKRERPLFLSFLKTHNAINELKNNCEYHGGIEVQKSYIDLEGKKRENQGEFKFFYENTQDSL